MDDVAGTTGGDPSDRTEQLEQLEQHVARLDREVAFLRSRLGTLESSRSSAASPAIPESAVPIVATPVAPRGAPVARAAWPPPRPVAPRTQRTGWQPDSETFLKWGGVGLVVLAVAFAVSTAVSRGWIGPELQLAGALVVSAALVTIGLRLRPARPTWTHALCSGGVLAFFTTFASDLFLDRADRTVALAATGVVAVGGFVLARTIRSEWVAATTLIGGSIGWAVIAGSGDGAPFIPTVGWFVATVGVTTALAVERRWYAVRPAAHAVGMIALLVLAGEADGGGDTASVAVASLLLVVSLFTVPSIGDLTSLWQQFEVQLAALAAPWAFFVTLIAFLDDRSDDNIAMTAIAIAAATATAALLLRIERPHRVSLALGASVTFSIGLAVLLSTTAVFVALAVQATGLVLLSRALGRNVRVLINAIVLATISVANTIAAMTSAWSDDAPWGDDVAHAIVIVALAVGIWFLDERDVRRAGALATLALVLIWTGSVLVHAPQGQAIVSVVWATIGTAVFVTGAVRKRTDAATTGLAVLALTVGKLLTVDLREVDTLWRAGLFFLVGIGLLRLGFLLPRLARSDVELGEPQDDQADGPSRPDDAAGRGGPA